MLVLAFDTATAVVTVALYEWAPGEGAHMRAIMDNPDRCRHAELLAPSIATVLAEAGVAQHDLSVISVGVGPGPWTGLRVGLATAGALGNALRVPVHGVCTLDAIAWASGRTKPFVVATDARGKQVYWARYDSADRRASGAEGAPRVGPPADAAAAGLPVLGEAATLYPDVLGEPSQPGHPSAAAIADLTVTRLNGGPGGLPLLSPEPLYLGRPDTREPGPDQKVAR
ncbi:tRNA (adenosine(37)-N6)-threonylcarbamoyltransferase complex dimerization subunit type 1 TsaB [Actinomadura scrupuli]|uniref:tRNA (adenosine(37)-N6)-threonylcarbamoyltransferase complex dimerization subunit type 1 TsaB n=1 Tax=Actinomadura scrupuli TaxID=559629 RepID=UPI003D99FBBC